MGVFMTIEYYQHDRHNPDENKELDDLWRVYADHRNREEIIELQRLEEVRNASRAYNAYKDRHGEIIQSGYGEPILKVQDMLLVYDNCWIIRDALRYNKQFPRSPMTVPEPGQECYLAICSLWPGPETVVIYSDHGWLAHHVPYIDAQDMRRAWLASLRPQPYQP